MGNSQVSKISLPQKVIKGGIWTFAFRAIFNIFIITRLIILARILSPHDFGLMGIALLVMATLESLSQTGIESALVQKKKTINEYLDTAWTVLVIRGTLIFLIIYFSAPYVSSFFNSNEAVSVIQIVGLTILFQSVTNIGVIFFLKELEFAKQFFYELPGILADFIVAISLAFLLKNVWALVFGLLAGSVVKCIASYIIHPYRPHLNLNKSKAKELFRFGKWISGSKIFIFISTYGDDICVGRVLGASTLGLYRLAYQISNTTASEIVQVIGRVAFPAYSKIQSDHTMLYYYYTRVLRFTVSISLPISTGIIFLAPDFTRIFLGEKWLPIIPAMQLLAISGFIRSVVSTGSPLFIGSGNPKFEFYMQLVRSVIIITAIYPLTVNKGISGTSMAVILSVIGMFIVWLIFSNKTISISVKRHITNFVPPLFSSALMICTIHFYGLLFDSTRMSQVVEIVFFLSMILTSALSYFLSLYILQLLWRPFDIIKDAKLIYKSFTNRRSFK